MAASVHDFTMNSIDGKPVPLADFRGKTLLIVNVASRCGFTGQYRDLEKIYRTYKDRGFVVLGFPANSFMNQEPGTNEEIGKFCSQKYDVTFPMFAKISVTGDDKAPLYQFLTCKRSNPADGGAIKWNFTKFLVDRDGTVIDRFGPLTSPSSSSVIKAIEQALRD